MKGSKVRYAFIEHRTHVLALVIMLVRRFHVRLRAGQGLLVVHRLGDHSVVVVVVLTTATAEAASHCSLVAGGEGGASTEGIVIVMLGMMPMANRFLTMTMGVKQSSVNFRTIHEEVTNIKLSSQIQSISLQSGILDDIQFRQCRLTRRMKSGASTEAAMSSEDTGAEDVPTHD